MQSIADVRQMLKDASNPVLSLYLRVDPALRENQSATPAWQIWLKNALKDVGEEIKDQYRDVWKQTHARLDDLISAYQPQTKTLAVFLGHDLEQTYELPVRLENSISFGEPAFAPLIRALDESQPFLFSYVTQEDAQIFVMSYDDILDQLHSEIDIPRSEWRRKTLMPPTSSGVTTKGGNLRDMFQDRMDEHKDRFFKDIAEEMRDLKAKHGVQEIVLAGNEQAAHAVRKYLKDVTVIGPVALSTELSPKEMLQEVIPVVSNHRQNEDLKLVHETIDIAKAGGRAARGSDVVEAMEHQMVEMLILPLVSENKAMVNKLSHDAIVAGAQVKVLADKPADDLIDDCGVAARLYYTR